MPLRAIQPDGTAVQAFDLDEAAWACVRDSIRLQRGQWRLPCCDSEVVAKTSKLGTHFFAHRARGGCEWTGETEHHIRLKSLAVLVARRHGWNADTEVTGQAPDGAVWKADVLATRGQTRVAVEVQWSPQTDDELLRRQQRYESAGVRALWLIRSTGFPVTKQIPAVVVREGGRGRYVVRIPAVTGARLRNEHSWAYEGISAETLLDAAFAGHLRWGVKTGEPLKWSVEAATTKCWRCGERTAPVTGIAVDVSATTILLSIDDFDADVALLREILPVEICRDHRIGHIKTRFSKTEGRSYLSNGCFACGILQGRFFEHEYVNNSTVRHRGASVADDRWKRLLEPRLSRHWRLLGVKPTRSACDLDGFIGDEEDDESY